MPPRMRSNLRPAQRTDVRSLNPTAKSFYRKNHEGPFLVRGEKTPLDVGMVFSDEPMMVMPGEFGVRLEDHFYMTAEGPVWFTEPAHSIDDPFGG